MVFLDWEEGALIRRIDVAPRHVYWNETGELVLLACDESYFGAWMDACDQGDGGMWPGVCLTRLTHIP